MDDNYVVMKERVLNYLTLFSNKDLIGVADLFSDDVELHDWESQYIGKKAVLEANKSIFDSVDTINAQPLNIYVDGLVAIAQLEIIINTQDILQVVDIITYNQNKQIVSVVAYNRNFSKP